MTAYNYKLLTKKLEKLGFRFFRQGKGSHTLWVRDRDGLVVPVPKHANQDIRKGTLMAIIKEVGLQNIQDLDKI